MHPPGDRQPVLDLRIAYAVAADDDGSRLAYRIRSAAQDFDQDLERQHLVREGHEIHRCKRLPPHRVNVTQRVGRGNPAELEWVIHERREEVGGLYERNIIADAEHSRVIAGVCSDQEVRVLPRLKLAQYLRQAVLRQLARSTRAGRVVGQSYFAGFRHNGLRTRGCRIDTVAVGGSFCHHRYYARPDTI